MKTFKVDSGIGALRTAVHEQLVSSNAEAPAVLYVHGATFPSALSILHRFDGHSWADALNAAGFDVYAFDQLGFGESDRYPEMSTAPNGREPLGRAPQVADQISRVVEAIRARTGKSRLNLIAHSWGTTPTARFAQAHPERVERLVLFAPIWTRDSNGDARPPSERTSWRSISAADQRNRFDSYVPKGESLVLDREHLARWCESYLASDPRHAQWSPPAVQVPGGPIADVEDMQFGMSPYDPGSLRCPVLIVRGEWDPWPTDADARRLFDALTGTACKRDVKIGRGTHVMHLESARHSLYAEVASFLAS